jgi:hypothetical protein
MNGYRIRNWKQFQHYSHRNPPWIKLHYEMLTSQDWVTLDDASRVLAVASMLIASRNEGCVPADTSYVQRVAYLSTKPNFKPLVDCGFLIPDGIPLASPSEGEIETDNRDRDASDTLAVDSNQVKKQYGEFKGVKLSDEEYSKLEAKHGAARMAAGIAILDDYMRSKGKRYKDHYATLKETSWVWQRVDERKGLGAVRGNQVQSKVKNYVTSEPEHRQRKLDREYPEPDMAPPMLGV